MQQNLRIPGPTPIPPQVAEALARPMINHRGPEFAELIGRVVDQLKYFFQTSQRILTFPSAGTGGWEATVPADGKVRIRCEVWKKYLSWSTTRPISAANSGPRWLIIGCASASATCGGMGVGPGMRRFCCTLALPSH